MEGQTIQEILLENINSKKESGITFIEGSGKTSYLSYKKLYLEASYTLHALQEKGINPGDEVVFQFQSNRSFLITFWACVLGKLIPVPIVLGTTSDIIHKIKGIWAKLKNPYVITDALYLKRILEDFYEDENEFLKTILSRLLYFDELEYSKKATLLPSSPSDLVFIQFSSGSTGSPKGVTNRQDSILYNIEMSIDKCQIQNTDTFLGWVPLTHDMGLIFFHLLPLLSNVNQFLMPSMLFLSTPELWIESLSEHKITISGSPNFGYVNVLKNIERLALENLSFEHLRLMVNSAEPVSIETCKKFAETFEPYGFKKQCISPAYGLAEAVLGVSMYNEEDSFKSYFLDRKSMSIGDAVVFHEEKSDKTASFADLGTYKRTEIKIADEYGTDLGKDTLGVIYLKSPAITFGYYNDPEISQEVISKKGWFNTGDIGFLHKDHLVVTGRQKEMIIVNGLNYFPNDLDILLEELPEIAFQQAITCNVYNEEKCQDEVFVFVHYTGKVKAFLETTSAIKKILSERIGITVKKVVAVDKVPKTTSGKIQRYVLRKKYLNNEYNAFLEECEKFENEQQEERYIAPSTITEKKLANIWAGYFDIEQVGVEDNFFYLGGNSIGVGILASKIQEVFGIQLDVRKLFTCIDFKDQVRLIEASVKQLPRRIKSTPIKSHYPLFGTQKRLFALHQMNPKSVAYNTPVVLQIDGVLNLKKCEDVFKKIIDKHEILRTSFHMMNGEPIQKIHDDVDFTLQFIETMGEGPEALVKNHIKPFDLTNPPLIRVVVCKENNIATKIILDIHHMVIDAASFDVLIDELETLYAQHHIQPLPIQYRDFIEWEAKKEKDGQLYTQKDFWLKQYEEIPEKLNLPTDATRVDVKDNEGDTLKFEVDADTKDKLTGLCCQQKVTMSTLTMSVFYILLFKLTNQEDIIIGTSTLGRWEQEFKNLIGLFINTIALRCQPRGNSSFLDFLDTVKTQVLKGIANEEYPFDQLLNDLKLKTTSNDSPLFNVTFEYHNFNWSDIKLGEAQLSRIDHANLFSRFDLGFRVVEKGDGVEFNLDYPMALYQRETIERFASYYIRIIEAIIKDNKIAIKDIAILSEEETKEQVENFNKTTLPYDKKKTVLDIFSEYVLSVPQNIAVVFEEKRLTYKELDIQSTTWAKYLSEKNVKPGDVVALMFTRSIDIIPAMLSILKAGATYLPIDVELPLSRKTLMLKECKVNTILTNIKEKEEESAQFSWIDLSELHGLKNADSEIVLPQISADSLLYIIFTSGSTGKPKGVMIQHRSIINLVSGLKERIYNPYGNKHLNIALLASHTFDASAQQIFGALLQGHSLHIANDTIRKDGTELRSFYNHNSIDVSDGTPTHLRFFVDALEEDATLNSLSSWILAGEVLSKGLVKQFHAKLGLHTQLYNFYGPTETCVDSTGYKIDLSQIDQYDTVPIGKPLSNERVYITDSYGKIVPVGTIGELCIAGDGLAQGYIGDPLLTSKKFSKDFISIEDRVYRTGDMAKWLPDGTIAYYGRNDDHVKIRGYRIHLREVEIILNQLPQIQQAVVTVNKDHQQLVGFVVSKEEINSKEIQEALEAYLPEYMVPRAYVQLPFLPMTSNGKIAKKLLVLPEENRNYVAPSNEMEKHIALLWEEVLGIEKVGIHDNFYELGGDSIKAIQLASRGKATGIHFQVKDIFNNQTISEILNHLKTVNTKIQEEGILKGKLPLHPIQKHFFERKYEVFDHYNQAMLIKISKSVSEDAIRFAIQELAKQHDALRIRYYKNEDKAYPEQRYDATIPQLLIKEEFTSNELNDLCTTYQADLDIFKGDLSRFVLFKTVREEENRLLIVIHHLIVDGVSFRIITEDLLNLIENYDTGNKKILADKSTSYRQWNEKLKVYANTESLKKEYGYWKKVLSNYSPLPVDIMYDHPITYAETDNLRVSISSDITHRLIHEVNNTYGTEINDILISALGMALSKWMVKSKVVIGLEGHGREELFNDMDINRTIGWFTSVYPICLNIENTEDIGTLIGDTKDMLREVPNKGIGYNILRFESDSEKIKTDLSIFYEDLIFNYLGSFDNSFSTKSSAIGSMSTEASGHTIAKQNVNLQKLTIDCIIVDSCLHIDLNYDRKRYRKATIQKLANAFTDALENILSHSDICRVQEESLSQNEDFEILSL